MIKKAILTGGGRATRLRPITNTINKHLIPLANKPMIFHAIEKVVRAGVTDIFINTNPGETKLQKVVGNGDRFGVNISFFEQVGGPQGIAHVVKLAQKFIGDDPFMFYLSDNIILSELDKLVDKFTAGNFDCMLALSQVKDPERFGVPIFNSAGELIEVREKPVSPPNNFAVTGIYLYGPKLFFEAFDQITKSARGEYEISDIHSYLLKSGRKVGHEEITGWWKDTGKAEDLILANKLLMDRRGMRSEIGTNVKQIGNVAIIEPVCVGDDSVLENCVIGPYAAISQKSVIKNTRLSNSIVFEECIVDSPAEIDQMLISRDSAMSAKNV